MQTTVDAELTENGDTYVVLAVESVCIASELHIHSRWLVHAGPFVIDDVQQDGWW